MGNWKKWTDRLLTLAFGICVLAVVWVLVQVTSFTSFRVPSPSMYPTLTPGDCILVNKWLMGARIFDIWEAVENKDVPIYRLPGIRKVKRNDVLVFHYPYPHKNDSLSMDMLLYYVKRCIALPGDMVEIRKGCYWINGTRKDKRWARMDIRPEPAWKGKNQWNVALGWTVQELGPLPVPARGQEVVMDRLAAKMYGSLIAWEQKKPLTLRDGNICLGDSLIRTYCFKENYYFMGGDNLDNSNDSRYWGLVPEPYIVGVATRVWKSVAPQSEKIRWNRIMKKIE